MRVAVPANVQRTIWSPKWSSTRDHGPALPGRIGTRRQISRYKSILNRTEQNGPGSSATLHQIVCGAICAPPEASTLRLWNQCDERVRYHRSQDRVPGPGTNCAMNRASGAEHGGGIASDVSSPTRAALGRVPSVQRPARTLRTAVDRYRRRNGHPTTWRPNSITGMGIQSCVFRLFTNDLTRD